MSDVMYVQIVQLQMCYPQMYTILNWGLVIKDLLNIDKPESKSQVQAQSEKGKRNLDSGREHECFNSDSE